MRAPLLLALFATSVAAVVPAAADEVPATEVTPEVEVPVSLRAAPPAVTPARALDLTPSEVETLRPGVRLHWVPVEGVRRVEVRVRFGQGALTLDQGLPSLASELLASMWTTSTEDHTPDQFSKALDALDASVSADVGLRDTTVVLDVPRTDLDAGLDLLHEALRTPAFHRKELRRVQREWRVYLTIEAPSSPGALAAMATNHGWYPADHPRGVRPSLDALRRVGRLDLVQRHTQLLDEAPIDVLVVGDVDPERLGPRVRALVAGLGADADPSPTPAARPPAGTSLALGVEMPTSDQAVLRVRVPAPSRDHTDAAAYEALVYQLGGHFLSRLNRNLREDKGLTYGARGTWRAWPEDGWWTFQVTVAEDDLGQARAELERELQRLRDGGLTADEVDAFTTNTVTQWNRTYRSAGTAAGTWGALLDHDEDAEDARRRLASRLAVTPEDTAAVAARWWDEEERLVVVVGERAALEPQLADLPTPVHWMLPDAAVFGTFSERAP